MKISYSASGMFLWFGAAISIAEIMTGMVLAPIGLAKGILAIILGHIIGAILMFGAGLIGAREELSAMQTTRIAFGRFGAIFFALLNITQLVGWTAVMLQSGSEASIGLFSWMNFSATTWIILLGLALGIWIISNRSNLAFFNSIIVFSLFLLSCLLLVRLTAGASTSTSAIVPTGMHFGTALDLSIVMPLSWLPLIADYTQHSNKSTRYTFICTAAYFVGSCLMYILGLMGALYFSISSIVPLFGLLGFGAFSLFIIFFSTVTTAYLDVFSAGESFQTISNKLGTRNACLVLLVISILVALFVPSTYYQAFLYFIGAVFIPMAGILLTSYFITKQNVFDKDIYLVNAIIWLVGFLFHRYLGGIGFVWGMSMPTLLLVSTLKIATYQIIEKKKV